MCNKTNQKLPVVLRFLLLVCLTKIIDCQRYCNFIENEHWINFVDVKIEKHEFLVNSINLDNSESPVINLRLNVEWSLDTNTDGGKQVDGFIVFLGEDVFPKQTLYPANDDSTCKYERGIIYLSTMNGEECTSTNSTLCSCNCDMDDCASLNETLCRGPKYYMNRRYSGNPFTVPGYTRSLNFDVRFNKEFDFILIPYYRQYMGATIQQKLGSSFCPETIAKSQEYNLDDGLELCCRAGILDHSVRNFHFSPAIPDFHTGTFNLSMSFSNVFYNSSLFSINLQALESHLDIFLEYTDLTAVENAPLNFKSNLEEKCLSQRITLTTTLSNLAQNTSYLVIFYPRDSDCKLDCWTSTEFDIPYVDTCDTKWRWCDENSNCLSDPYFANVTCSCKPGYSGTPYLSEYGNEMNGYMVQSNLNGYGCFNHDSCLGITCPPNSFCIDSAPPLDMFECECKEGFIKDNSTNECRDKDGCLGIRCPLNSACFDIPAPRDGYSCSCNKGYVSDGYDRCKESEGTDTTNTHTTDRERTDRTTILALAISLGLVLLLLVVLIVAAVLQHIHHRRNNRIPANFNAKVPDVNANGHEKRTSIDKNSV